LLKWGNHCGVNVDLVLEVLVKVDAGLLEVPVITVGKCTCRC